MYTGVKLTDIDDRRDYVRRPTSGIVGEEYSFSNQDGTPIHHRFELERDGFNIVIILKSGSGAVRGDGTPHNSQYNQGVERIISVLSELREPIEKIVLDTRKTRSLNLTEDERTLPLQYPLSPWNHDSRDLRLEMGRLAQNIGQEPGAKGGNNQKQLRVYIRDINPGLGFDSIAEVLSGVDVERKSNRRLPFGLPLDGETTFTRSNSPDGWLYVVTNPMWPEWSKIGVTRDLSKRLSSYNTGAPTSQVFYEVRFSIHHQYARQIEYDIHRNLLNSPLRGDTSEWYKISVDDAKQIIEDAISVF